MCPAVSVPRQNGLGVVAAGALAGFLYLQRREAAAAQAAADAQLAGQRASLAGLRTQARPMRRWRSPHCPALRRAVCQRLARGPTGRGRFSHAGRPASLPKSAHLARSYLQQP